MESKLVHTHDDKMPQSEVEIMSSRCRKGLKREKKRGKMTALKEKAWERKKVRQKRKRERKRVSEQNLYKKRSKKERSK